MKIFLIFALLTCYENLKDNFPPILPNDQSVRRVSLYGSGDFFKMESQESIWKPLRGYEGVYECDQFGVIKRLKREIYRQSHRQKSHKVKVRERFCFWKIANTGYWVVGLSQNGIGQTKTIHRIVWEYHNGPIPEGFAIHHIDGNKKNASIQNLSLIDLREHTFLHKSTGLFSQHIGVYKSSPNRWCSSIRYKGESIYLGIWKDELDAAAGYQKALSAINKGKKPKGEHKVRPKGTVVLSRGRWQVSYRLKHLGMFATEVDGRKFLEEYFRNTETT